MDPRSNVADVILTEGFKEALAHALESVSVQAVLMDDADGDLYDVVDSHYGREGVTLVLNKRESA